MVGVEAIEGEGRKGSEDDKRGLEVIRGIEASQHTHRQINPLHTDLRTSRNGLGLLLSRALLIHFSTSTAREESNACTQCITTPKSIDNLKQFASSLTTLYDRH